VPDALASAPRFCPPRGLHGHIGCTYDAR